MRIYKNLQLLDIPSAKLKAIAAYRKQFNLGIIESKEAIESLLDFGTQAFDGYAGEFEWFISAYFSYELEKVEDEQSVNGLAYKLTEEPDGETQKALDWYALRLPFEREYIEKIIAWEKRGMMYPARG